MSRNNLFMEMPIARIRAKFLALKPVLDERLTRLWAGAEAEAVGDGGITAVARATGMSRTTIPGPALEQELARRPEPDAQRAEYAREPVNPVADAPAAARGSGASAPSEPDADWYRCLADVFTLAKKLER